MNIQPEHPKEQVVVHGKTSVQQHGKTQFMFLLIEDIGLLLQTRLGFESPVSHEPISSVSGSLPACTGGLMLILSRGILLCCTT